MADLKMKMLMNGRIYTADKENPYGDAMIIGGGKILWVGEQAERKDADRLERILRTENGERIDLSQAEIIDLKGRRVIPGFADVHMHPVMLADFRKKITVMPPEICSIRDLRKRSERGEAGRRPVSGSRDGAMTSRGLQKSGRRCARIWTGDAAIHRL